MKRPPTYPKFRPTSAKPLSHLVAELVDPLLLRKAGMTTGLVASWPEIVGLQLSQGCRPERLAWPAGGEAAGGRPAAATLVVACDAAFLLRLQHGSGELIARVNSFFGYAAVDRLRLVQKPAEPPRPSRKPVLRPLDAQDRRTISDATANIESPRLKAALAKFGESVLGRNVKPQR